MAFFHHLGLFFIQLLLQPHLLPARHLIAGKDFGTERVPSHNEIAAVIRRGGGGGGGGGHGGGGGRGGGGGHVGGEAGGRGNGRRPNPAAVIPVIAGGSTVNRHHHGATRSSGTVNRTSALSYFVLAIWVPLLLSQV